MTYSVHVCMPALQQPGSQNSERPKSLASVLKNMVSYPPLTHTFLKRPFLTDFKKYTHTPPYRMKFWCFGQKNEKPLKKHEFAPRWHVMNVPERYLLPLSPMMAQLCPQVSQGSGPLKPIFPANACWPNDG